MQPPPRKLKESQQLKKLFSDQITKLQSKQHQDQELLEEIRSFVKQRAVVERDYAQALQRLAGQHQKRDWQRGNCDISSSSVFGAWRSVVDATAQSASARFSASEEYSNLTLQASRSLRANRDVHNRKVVERLQRIQAELLDTVKKAVQVKKRYLQLCLMVHDVGEKVPESQIKARKSDFSLFHFKSQKMFMKQSLRLKGNEDRLTEARNEYLLTIASLRAHLQLYYSQDLRSIMEQMDGSLYEELRGHFTRLCGTELDTCGAIHSLLSHTWGTVCEVTREGNMQQFLQNSAAFSQIPEFSFQPAPTDQVSELQDLDVSPGHSHLQQEVDTWASEAAKDYKVIAHGQRAVELLEARLRLLSGETSLSVEQKITEVQDTIRKATVDRVKAEARLQLLSGSVEGTQACVRRALLQAQEEVDRENRLRHQRTSTRAEEELELSDLEEVEEDTFPDRPLSSAALCVLPAACRVLYSYQLSQADVMEGAEPNARLDDEDVEGWLQVGPVGRFPSLIMEILEDEELEEEGEEPEDEAEEPEEYQEVGLKGHQAKEQEVYRAEGLEVYEAATRMACLSAPVPDAETPQGSGSDACTAPCGEDEHMSGDTERNGRPQTESTPRFRPCRAAPPPPVHKPSS